VHLAKELERAAFDYVMIEDSSNIPYTYKNSHDTYVRYAVDSPKLDPSVLAPFMIQATSRIGIITTLSTTEYNPFMLARLTNTLDHVSDGRSGWNLNATTWPTSMWNWCTSYGIPGMRMRW
jgi:alkanesulfonate monooxygenase SsuD/methylene tetrahydromethanopterin reductase-like flavin-dependent oxidoreductase (luciferase family)